MRYATKPGRIRYRFVRMNPEKRFRLEDYRFGKRGYNVVHLTKILENPYAQFQVVTEPLSGGTYKFKVVSIDDLYNENTGSEVSTTLEERPWLVQDFTISDVTTNDTDDHDVTFTWSAPSGGSTPTYYRIYGNNGSGNIIDYTNILGQVGGTTYTQSINLEDGNWLFVMETVSGDKETRNDYAIQKTLPVSNTIPDNPNIPNNPAVTVFSYAKLVNVQLTNVSVGRCKISFIWLYGDIASHFRVYHDNGTGTIDWDNHKYRFARLNNVVQEYTTTQVITVDVNTDYKFGIRAESLDGVIDTNEDEYLVTLDGVAPDNVSSLTGDSI